MDNSKRSLLKRYRKAMDRAGREHDAMVKARDRKYYWKNQAKILKENIQLSNEGQLEMSL